MKMTSEEEVVLLREELEAARKELGRCRAECRGTRKLLCRKVGEAAATPPKTKTLTCDDMWAFLQKRNGCVSTVSYVVC